MENNSRDDLTVEGEIGIELEGLISGVGDSTLRELGTYSFVPPPDGGRKAWTAVACGFLVIMNTGGLVGSFGVFQTYYSATLKSPVSSIAWIGSVHGFLLLFVGMISGRLTDAGYFRHIFLLGCLLQLLGIFIASSCTNYWQVFFAQGILLGLGSGCIFCPTLVVVSTYFEKRKGFALGVVGCGNVTGGIVFPSVVRLLLPSIGFTWTVRAIGVIQLITLAVAGQFLRSRIPPRKSGPFIEWQAFQELDYLFYVTGGFFSYWSILVGTFFIASFSRDTIGLPYAESLNFLIFLNGCGFVGRLIPTYLADMLGPMEVFAATLFLGGVVTFCWAAVDSVFGLYVWAGLYGISIHAMLSLFPVGLLTLTTDTRKAGVRAGMAFTITSVGDLTGPPIAGAIIVAFNGSYFGAQVFAGGALLVGTGFVVAAMIAMRNRLHK
ncbi:Nn.00g053610.m01.CDS01 [Neocucurbitaria sp. VM-36]